MALPHIWVEGHPIAPHEALDPAQSLSPIRREETSRPTCPSEAHDAKIRALQNAIQHGTYHVSAEQLADKMLRHMLRDELL
jgi:anti-sigma28 factor (negative regulator of flagellin synthesis)